MDVVEVKADKSRDRGKAEKPSGLSKDNYHCSKPGFDFRWNETFFWEKDRGVEQSKE